VRRISYDVADGQRWIAPRSWEWFDFYVLNDPVPQGTYPKTWSQYAQGAAPGTTGALSGGSFYINKPNLVYALNCDCVCYPIALADDTTKEAIPYLWTDAVPFFAAYYALLSAQTNARMADAAQMYKGHYNEFMERARKQSNPDINTWVYRQAGDPTQGVKMGISKGGAA
jgi:hypothetical protein